MLVAHHSLIVISSPLSYTHNPFARGVQHFPNTILKNYQDWTRNAFSSHCTLSAAPSFSSKCIGRHDHVSAHCVQSTAISASSTQHRCHLRTGICQRIAPDLRIGLWSFVRCGIIFVMLLQCICLFGRMDVLAAEGMDNTGAVANNAVKSSRWTVGSKLPQVLKVFKKEGPILILLLGLSAFFSMAETSITTLWPWKVSELAEKDSEDGAFKLLRSDVTRFLTSILIGTTVVNVGATALVTNAATEIFGDAGIPAATGVMTVTVLLLTEITPKSIAVHHASQVIRIVVKPIAWISLILYPVGRVATWLSLGIIKLLGLKRKSEPCVTEDELKLMLRGAELSGAIEEEEQDMIENVLDSKDIYVENVMTPLVDVVAIDSGATLAQFHELWLTHQYSRIPVYEQRVDNIVGIVYAMELLGYIGTGEMLDQSYVSDVAHKPAYFVPDLMSVWDLLKEFRVRKVHMAVVVNEYGGTVGIVTLEDVVEEIVGEISDENDSKEDMGKIVIQEEGVYVVDATTSIDQLSEDLKIEIPEGYQCETVSGFVCKMFGYIPQTGECIDIALKSTNEKECYEHVAYARIRPRKSEEKFRTYKVKILSGDDRKVDKVQFEYQKGDDIKILSKSSKHGLAKIAKRKACKDNKPNDTTKFTGEI